MSAIDGKLHIKFSIGHIHFFKQFVYDQYLKEWVYLECTLYLTENCNLKCSYCYEGDDKRKKILSSDDLKTAIDFIVQHNPEGEKLDLTFLGGEPLLNKKLIYECMDIINQKYPESKKNFEFHITTNGVLLDADVIELFKKYNVDVSISIDGDKRTHNLNRKSKNGVDVYDNIIENMRLMQKMQLSFSVRMTVTENNVEFLYENLQYFYHMGIHKFHLGIDNMGEWTKQGLKILDEQMYKMDQFYLDVICREKDATLNLHDYKIGTFVAASIPQYCSGGSAGHLTINSSGELFPCGYVVNDEVWNLGTVRTGLNRKKFLESARGHVAPKAFCHECDIAFTCSGAKCGFCNYVKTGKLNVHSEQTCKRERILYKHNLNVYKQMYARKDMRLMRYLQIARDQKIELSKIMKTIICEVEQVSI